MSCIECESTCKEFGRCSDECYCLQAQQMCRHCFCCRATPFYQAPVEVKIVKERTLGLGAKPLLDIPADGVYIGEYVGTKISKATLRTLQNNDLDGYVMKIPGLTMTYINGKYGNQTRFINHSCNPNVRFEKWAEVSMKGEITRNRIAVYSNRAISKTKYLGVNYNLGKEYDCKCGSSECKGHM